MELGHASRHPVMAVGVMTLSAEALERIEAAIALAVITVGRDGHVHIHAPFENKSLITEMIRVFQVEADKWKRPGGPEALQDIIEV